MSAGAFAVSALDGRENLSVLLVGDEEPSSEREAVTAIDAQLLADRFVERG